MSDNCNMYEGMFLFPQAATGNLKAAADHVTDLLGRGKVEVVAFSKWDERRLAYEIKGNKRGVYFHSYFKAEPGRIAEIERAANLSEELLRFMVTRADHVPAEVIEAADGRDRLADELAVRAAAPAEASASSESADAGDSDDD